MSCDRTSACPFHAVVEPSIAKRVKYASSYPYCKGGRHESCAIRRLLVQDRMVPRNLMPEGGTGDYAGESGGSYVRPSANRFLVIEDSPIFAALAASVIQAHFRGAEVVRRLSFEDAADELRSAAITAVVCGYGLGGDRTAHDVRRLTAAPMVILTGRPGDVQPPTRAQVVEKSAGPEALANALRAATA